MMTMAMEVVVAMEAVMAVVAVSGDGCVDDDDVGVQLAAGAGRAARVSTPGRIFVVSAIRTVRHSSHRSRITSRACAIMT